MLNAPPKTDKSDPTEGTRLHRLWARAPKALVVAGVLLADLAFNSGHLLTRHNVAPTVTSPTGGLSCERGTCQREHAGTPATVASVAVPTGKPRLLEFTSKHCASCAKMAPLVRKMEHDCTAHDGTILPVDVDTDAGDLLATRNNVNALPTFVMIDSNGDELRRLVGEQPREHLTVALADVNGVLCTVL